MPDESPEEEEARSFFEEALGLAVIRVLRSTARTPDFFVDGEFPGYALEVKSRFDDEDFVIELERGRTKVRKQSLGCAYWAADNTLKAMRQLASKDAIHSRFWVLWFAVKRRSARDAMFSQVIGTLYGVRQVVYWDETTGAAIGRECLFVVPGAFERWPQIDAAIVTAGGNITLCVNEFTDRAPAFESSLLCQAFVQRGGPIRPSDLEAHHGFWAIRDLGIDRSSEEAVRRYLSERYHVSDVHILDIKAHTASAVVPRRRDGS
jgi:hypothetical protein